MSGDKVQPNPKKVELRADVVGRLLAMTDDDRERQSKIILEKVKSLLFCWVGRYFIRVNIVIWVNVPTQINMRISGSNQFNMTPQLKGHGCYYSVVVPVVRILLMVVY